MSTNNDNMIELQEYLGNGAQAQEACCTAAVGPAADPLNPQRPPDLAVQACLPTAPLRSAAQERGCPHLLGPQEARAQVQRAVKGAEAKGVAPRGKG